MGLPPDGGGSYPQFLWVTSLGDFVGAVRDVGWVVVLLVCVYSVVCMGVSPSLALDWCEKSVKTLDVKRAPKFGSP